MMFGKPWRPVHAVDQGIALIYSVVVAFLLQRENDFSNIVYDPTAPQTWVPQAGISFDPNTGEPQLTWDDTIVVQEQDVFQMLPNELLHNIFALLGPKGRTQCWSTSRWFRKWMNVAQGPASLNGFNWKDTLPVVATEPVGQYPQLPFVHGQVLCVVTNEKAGGIISVIDPTKGYEVIHTIQVGGSPWRPVVYSGMLYVANHGDGTISVVDLGGWLPAIQ